MDGSGAVGRVGSGDLGVVLVSGLEYGRYVVFDCEVVGDPSLLVEELGFSAVSLPGTHLQ